MKDSQVKNSLGNSSSENPLIRLGNDFRRRSNISVGQSEGLKC